MDRRRRRSDEDCPMTPAGVDSLLKEVQEVRSKVDELHEKIIHAKMFVTGMRAGAGMVMVFAGSFVLVIWALLSGKISIKDLWGLLF